VANAVDYALRSIGATHARRLTSLARSAFTTCARDVGTGFLSTAKLVVMASGSAALLATGVLVSSPDARDLLMTQLSSAPSIAVRQADATQVDVQTDQTMHASAGDPQQKRIVQYLARRYRVADEAVRRLVSAAFQIGKEKNLDPLLILSVVAVESSLNPFAQSAMGAQGLMQVMTRVHAQRFEPHGGETAALDPIANMKVGSSILHEAISRGGSVERGLQLYVGAGNMPDDGGYGVRVLGERSRLQMAANGKVDAAISAAIRAAAPVAAPAAESKQVAIPLNAETSGPIAVPRSSEAPHTPASSERAV
jgi:hypothetical protein